MTLRTVGSGVTYDVVNPESKKVRQILISQMKVLERGDVPDTTAGEELPRWVALWTGEQSSSSLQAATQASRANGLWLRALQLGEQLPDMESNGVESQSRESPSLPAQAVDPTPGAERAREGLRWALARRARAAPGGVYVRARRGRRVSKQEAGDMTYTSDFGVFRV